MTGPVTITISVDTTNSTMAIRKMAAVLHRMGVSSGCTPERGSIAAYVRMAKAITADSVHPRSSR